MKRSLILILLSYLLNGTVLAQGNNAGEMPVAVPVAKGVWVYLGNTIPRNMHYVIERSKAGGKQYEKLGETSVSATQQEMNERYLTYIKYFENLATLDDQKIAKLWQHIQAAATTDKIYSDNLPMMHLMAGTAFFDSQATGINNYQYRIRLTDKSGKIVSEKVSNPSSSFPKSNLPIIYFEGKKYADGKLSITWRTKEVLKMGYFNIYKTVFGKNDYQKLKTEKGIYQKGNDIILYTIDSLGSKPGWFEYKIAATDAYGNEGELQGYVSGSNIQDYYTPPVTNLRAANTMKNHEIKLSWQFANKKYLNGISIMRSNQYDSGYQRLATVPASDTTYTDIVPLSGENYYYYLLMLSANDQPLPTAKVFAAFTDANEIPEAPDKIDAAPDPSGIKVYWTAEAPFIKGFYVYRRANPENSFVQASPLLPFGSSLYVFSDSSALLVPGTVYEYVVRSIGENNRLSINSDTVTAVSGKKKNIPAPMNLSYSIRDHKLNLLWDDMTQWVDHLLGYRVYRKEGNADWQQITTTFQPKKIFYTDSIPSEKSYAYAVISFDDAGNESKQAVINIPAVTEDLPPTPAGIKISQTEDAVYITWGQMTGDIRAIRIYRSEPGQDVKLIGIVIDNDSFTDKNTVKGKLYFYNLSATDAENRESQKSASVSIRLR